MNKIISLFFFVTATIFGQNYTITPPPGSNAQPLMAQNNNPNDVLAQNYFDRGEFDNALLIYEELVKKQPNNYLFFQKQIICYQQLKQFDKAHQILTQRINKLKQPNLYVELGYNYQLQKQQDKAETNYKTALSKIKENPNNVYAIARDFEQKSLLIYAIESYTIAQNANPQINFDYQIALLQGQLGNFELMINALLDYAYKYPENRTLVQSQLSRYIQEDQNKNFVGILRKSLLLKTQKTQDLFWNEFMSWFFITQKEYNKAFIQEKAIYKRNPNTFNQLNYLIRLAQQDNDVDTQVDILNFIIQNTTQPDILLDANYKRLEIDINKSKKENYLTISQQFEKLFQTYGYNSRTIKLQLLKAHFDAFYLKQHNTAITLLKQTLELPLNSYTIAEVKLELADILLITEKYNQAIIYYAQVETDLANDAIAHQASLKIAKANYFKGDFEWAKKQFEVLKTSTSQLIANDALEMYLVITDNTEQDSTQVALKKFSKADFYLYQNKYQEALTTFKTILEQHKEESIIDDVLIKMGELYEKQQQYPEALAMYEQIIDKYPEEIYIDEALYYTAEIYRKQLQQPDKAKTYYEKIILKYPDSIYFVESQYQYRKIRGDNNL